MLLPSRGPSSSTAVIVAGASEGFSNWGTAYPLPVDAGTMPLGERTPRRDRRPAWRTAGGSRSTARPAPGLKSTARWLSGVAARTAEASPSTAICHDIRHRVARLPHSTPAAPARRLRPFGSARATPTALALDDEQQLASRGLSRRLARTLARSLLKTHEAACSSGSRRHRYRDSNPGVRTEKGPNPLEVRPASSTLVEQAAPRLGREPIPHPSHPGSPLDGPPGQGNRRHPGARSKRREWR